jgi:hypothetical protein
MLGAIPIYYLASGVTIDISTGRGGAWGVTTYRLRVSRIQTAGKRLCQSDAPYC